MSLKKIEKKQWKRKKNAEQKIFNQKLNVERQTFSKIFWTCSKRQNEWKKQTTAAFELGILLFANILPGLRPTLVLICSKNHLKSSSRWSSSDFSIIAGTEIFRSLRPPSCCRHVMKLSITAELVLARSRMPQASNGFPSQNLSWRLFWSCIIHLPLYGTIFPWGSTSVAAEN